MVNKRKKTITATTFHSSLFFLFVSFSFFLIFSSFPSFTFFFSSFLLFFSLLIFFQFSSLFFFIFFFSTFPLSVLFVSSNPRSSQSFAKLSAASALLRRNSFQRFEETEKKLMLFLRRSVGFSSPFIREIVPRGYFRCDYFVVTYCNIDTLCTLKNSVFRRSKNHMGRTDGRTRSFA